MLFMAYPPAQLRKFFFLEISGKSRDQLNNEWCLVKRSVKKLEEDCGPYYEV